MIKYRWINSKDEIPLSRQCWLLGINRSTIYAKQKLCGLSGMDLVLCQLLDEEYTRHPFYGSRRMVMFLKEQGHLVNRKKVQRLMRTMGLAGMSPGPNTSKPGSEHKVYPYLLRGVNVARPNQVWSTDITYIRLNGGVPIWLRSSTGIAVRY